MIHSVEVERFRGIREGKVDQLTPLVVLVGPNGCGKSTLLEALLIGGGAELGSSWRHVLERRDALFDQLRWVFWKGEKGYRLVVMVAGEDKARSQCQLELLVDRTEHGLDEYRVTAGRWVAGQEGGAAGDTFMIVTDPRQMKWDPVRSGFSNAVLVDAARRQGEPLHRLYSECTRQGRREEIKRVIAEIVPGVIDVEILTEQDQPVLYFVYSDRSVPAALAGDGVFALLRLILQFGANSEGTILLEEPEVHQHPAALRQSARAIWVAIRRGLQVVLTTHSLELIDALLAESNDQDLEKLSLYRLALSEDGLLASTRIEGSDVAFARTEIENDLR